MKLRNAFWTINELRKAKEIPDKSVMFRALFKGISNFSDKSFYQMKLNQHILFKKKNEK